MSFSIPEIGTFDISRDNRMLTNFEIYYREAEFALSAIQSRLNALPTNSNILEIGGGISLLSHAINSKFKNVYCLEPFTNGYNEIKKLREVVNSHEDNQGHTVTFLDSKIEDFESSIKFDFIFSINVMEHVDNPKQALNSIYKLLHDHGEYYFICPNYKFPYEPHFNIPIIFNRKLTFKIFQKRIRKFPISTPIELWVGINWISLKKIIRSNRKFNFDFHSEALQMYFERLRNDSSFKNRKGYIFVFLAKLGKHLVLLLPASYRPIIECSATKKIGTRNIRI